MEPVRVIAGDTWEWDVPAPSRTASDGTMTALRASDGWSLSYLFVRDAAVYYTVSASADGDDFTVAVAASVTTGWPSGLYRWTARATKDLAVYTVGTGQIYVAPDPTLHADPRTHAERCLAAIETALESTLTTGAEIVEFEMDGLRVKKNRTELLDLRDRYASLVRRSRGGSGLSIIPVRLRR